MWYIFHIDISMKENFMPVIVDIEFLTKHCNYNVTHFHEELTK